MGTQQILLIVLSVIIVGIAVVVGIMMFNTQAYNSNKSAVASELTTYGSEVVKWWKTPKAQGGAGQDSTLTTAANISPFVGFNETINGKPGLTNRDTGKYIIDSASGTTVVLKGLGNDTKGTNHPRVTTTVSLPDGAMNAISEDAASW